MSLALLVVDVSESWEEHLKACERGYFTDWNSASPGSYRVADMPIEKVPFELSYPHGSVRAGFNAITDTVRQASQCEIPIFAVYSPDGWSDGEEQTCHSLRPYIPNGNESPKGDFSAFVDGGKPEDCFAAKIAKIRPTHLMVIGYDRDFCVLHTAKDAVARGFKVITSEHCMLTKETSAKGVESMAYYRQHTQHLESLVDVWNCILRHRDATKDEK